MPDDSLPASAALIKHFEDEVNNRLGTLNDFKVRYRRYHQNLAFFLILFAALNTTVVTLSQGKEVWAGWGNLAIIFSALVAILTGVNGLFRPKQRHINNAAAHNSVYDIMHRYKWRALQSPPISVAELGVLHGDFRIVEKAFFADWATLDAKDG